MPFVCCLLLAASVVLTSDGSIEVRDGGAARLSPDQFAMRVNGAGDLPPVAGMATVESGILKFRPRFPLQPGLTYRVSYAGSDTLLTVPKIERSPSTRVDRIYPSADKLPANLLKLYLHFSAPMSRGEAWRRLHLIAEDGKEIANPFLEIEEELWDREARRLTVLFDPGRIKRGLVPHSDVGPALIPGRRYRIVVDRDWPDANGTALTGAFEKEFMVLDDDRTPPALSGWRVTAPKRGTREPLRVDFPEPLDAALLQRLIRVDGVEGDIVVENNERSWLFTPESPWKPGAYNLEIGTFLEDLAGNRIDRKFDVDTFERVEMRQVTAFRQLRFSVGN